MTPPYLLGLHIHGWPNADGNKPVAPAPTHIKYNAVRLHDGGVMWSTLNPAPGVYNWTPLDNILRAHPAGTYFIWPLVGTPPFALIRPEEANTRDAYGRPGGAGAAKRECVQTFITALLNHMDVTAANTINAVEIGNEPNYDRVVMAGSSFWGTAAEHVDMALGVRLAINSLSRNVKIWTPGFQCGKAQMHAFFAAPSSMMLTGAQLVNAVSYHPYSRAFQTGSSNILTGDSSIASIKSLMALYGIDRLPLYIGEYGIDGDPQAKSLQDYLAAPVNTRYEHTLSLLVETKQAGAAGFFAYAYDQPLFGDFINDTEGTIAGWNAAASILGM